MVLAALVVAVAAASPETSAPPAQLAVVPIVRSGTLSPALAEGLAGFVRDGLVDAGYTVLTAEQLRARIGKQDPATCGTNLGCYAFVAKSLNVPVLVRVEGGQVESDLALFVQAIRAEDGTALGEQSALTRVDVKREALLTQLKPFFEALHRTLPAANAAPIASSGTTTAESGAANVEAPSVAAQSSTSNAPGSEATAQPSFLRWQHVAAAGLGALAIGAGAYGVSRLAARSEAARNQAAASPDHRGAYAGDVNRFGLEGGVGVGIAIASAGLAVFFATRPDETPPAPAVAIVPLRGGGALIGLNWEVR